MMRIMYVIATLDAAGAERQLVHLATGLDRSRFSPFVCCLTRGGELLEAKLRSADVPYCVLRKPFKFDLRVVLQLMRRMRELRPNIVHTWLFTANAFGRTAALLAPVPHIVASERNVDEWKTCVHRAIDRWLARRSDMIVANAQAVREFCIREGIAPEKVCVIPNGIDVGRFGAARDEALRRSWGARADSFVIGTVARLSEQKGIDVLIEAFARVASTEERARLVIVGEGEHEAKLRGQAAATGFGERIGFVGFERDVPKALASFDCFVLASRWEGLPNAVMEAMAARCPVVATDVGGTRELVRTRQTGLLVPAEDAAQLADAIREIMQHPGLAASVATNARKLVESEYSVRRMVEATEAAYAEVAGQ